MSSTPDLISTISSLNFSTYERVIIIIVITITIIIMTINSL